jgi:hypothetical protein
MLITITKKGKYKRGQVVDVSRNDAHALIDSGEGKVYQNKMMISQRTKNGSNRTKNY